MQLDVFYEFYLFFKKAACWDDMCCKCFLTA